MKRNRPKLRRIGRLRHKQSGQCIVADRDVYEKKSLVKLSQCSDYDKKQRWHEYEQFSLQLAGVLCLDFEDFKMGLSYVRLAKCHFAGGGQEWKWMNGSSLSTKNLLFNPASGRCLSAKRAGIDTYLTLEVCNNASLSQHFELLL